MFITIDKYYNAGSALSNPAPKKCPIKEIDIEDSKTLVTRMEKVKPVYFGTVTLDPKKWGFMDTQSQVSLLQKYMKDYISKIGNNLLIYVYEFHKDHRPHIHLLTNANKGTFYDTFAPLGARNKHKSSLQNTINILSVFKYMLKYDELQKIHIGDKMIYFIYPDVRRKVSIAYNSTRDPVNKIYNYYPRCSFLPTEEEENEGPKETGKA